MPRQTQKKKYLTFYENNPCLALDLFVYLSVMRSAMKRKKMENNYSKFWIGDNSSLVDDFLGTSKKSYKKDLVAIASYKRAISNFVNIVTGKNIPVKFASKGISFTDNKTVTIGSNLNDKTFDVAVGLALHESSHILLSDFNLLKMIRHNIPDEIFRLGEQKHLLYNGVLKLTKTILNYVEDRRVDQYVFKTSPGYKGYYHSMYNKYFYSKDIDNGLISSEMRTEDIKSYLFRIINLHNPKSQLNALRGLKEIYHVIDFMNIDRLENTKDSLNVALKVVKIILENISKSTSDDENVTTTNSSSMDTNGNSSSDDENVTTTNSSSMDTNGNSSSDDENDDGIETKELSDRQKRLLKKAFDRQENFLDEGPKKTSITKSENRKVEALDNSEATYKDVGKNAGIVDNQDIKCLVIKKFNRRLVESEMFYIADKRNEKWYSKRYNFVENGLRLGKTLGRKLKIRGEETSLKYTRKDSGKIDKRLISELGFGNSNIFSQSFVTKFNKAYLHISVDASSSMSGNKWNKAMTSAIAMIKACDMAGNIEVVVSVRTTHSTHQECIPLIMVVYDSRKDKISKINSLFRSLDATGTTPEGLCFEAIMNDLIPGNSNTDSYFINYSDGQPYFSSGSSRYRYAGWRSVKHTKDMVNKMKMRGLKVLSYYISGSNHVDKYSGGNFKEMYGQDASFISPVNMMSVAKTMNKKFLKK